MGCRYNDHIIVKWFNTAAGYGNSSLRDVIKSGFKSSGTHSYEKIPRALLPKFKYAGYPLINTNTFELEWWIDKTSSEYKRVLDGINKFLNPINPVKP
jgi:hypothetical protein